MQIYYMKKEKIPIPVCNSDPDDRDDYLQACAGGDRSRDRGLWQRFSAYAIWTGILPIFYLGLALNIFCVYVYDSSGVSSGSCQKHSDKGSYIFWKSCILSAKNRRTAGKAGSILWILTEKRQRI